MYLHEWWIDYKMRKINKKNENIYQKKMPFFDYFFQDIAVEGWLKMLKFIENKCKWIFFIKFLIFFWLS